MKISLKGLIGGIAAVLIGVAAVAGLAAPLTFGGSEPFGRSFYETGFDALLFRSETVYRGLALSKTPLILVGLIVVAQIVCGAAGIVCGVLSVFFPKLRKVSRALTIACVVLLAMYAAGGLYYNAGATVVPRPSGLQSEGNPSLHNDFTMTVYGTTMAYIPVAIGAPILFVRCLLDIFLNDVALCGEDVPLIGRSFHITARGTVRAVLAAILGALAFVALRMPFTKVAEGYSESGLFWAIFFQTKLRSIYYEKEFLGLYLFDTQFALAVVAIVFAVLAFLSPKYRAASSVLSLLCVAFALADAGVSFWLCIMQNEIYNAGAVSVMWIPCLFSLFVGVEYLQALFIRDKGLAADRASDFEDEGAEAEYLVRYYEMYREGLLGEEDFIRLKEQILHRGDEDL